MASGRRPIEITLLAWLFLVIGAASFGFEAWTLADPELRTMLADTEIGRSNGLSVKVPGAIWMASGLVEAILVIAAAIGMLLGRNWARWLFLIVQALGTVLWWLITGFAPLILAVSSGIYLIFLLVLLNPRARAYFTEPG